jgi:hypothetical protein
MIPARLALSLQDDGWLLRQEVVWDKGWARPESARDRVTRTHETVSLVSGSLSGDHTERTGR